MFIHSYSFQSCFEHTQKIFPHIFTILIWKIATLIKTLKDFFGKYPERSPDFTRIVNKRHFARISGYLLPQNVMESICYGGFYDEKTLYVYTTLKVSLFQWK